jgi:hypothetical protein
MEQTSADIGSCLKQKRLISMVALALLAIAFALGVRSILKRRR